MLIDLNDALNEVLGFASANPRIRMEGSISVTQANFADVLEMHNQGKLTSGPQRTLELSDAQETVCRYTWEHCGRHTNPIYENWEHKFTLELNPYHELYLWFGITGAFQSFLGDHPNENKQEVISTLCRLSAGLEGGPIKGRLLRELERLAKKFQVMA